MSLFPSSFSRSFIASHKASSSPFYIPLMIHGAHSPPILLPAHIPIPPSFPNLLDVMGTTASSYAIAFQEIPILVSHFSPLVSRTQSQSLSVTCLPALRRPILVFRLCAPAVHFFRFSFTDPFCGAVYRPFQSVECGEFLSRNRYSPSRLPSLRPHQLGFSTPLASTSTRGQGLMGCRTSSSRQAMVTCPSPLIQSALTLSCTRWPGVY